MARRRTRVLGLLAAAWAAIIFLGAGLRVLADCSAFDLPFNDLGSTSFCAQIAEAYWTGLSNGTSATSYSPTADVPREQMAAFVTRTLDKSLLRGSRRAALDQWWTSTPHYDQSLGLVSVGANPALLKSDGTDVWVANKTDGTVTRVQASSGKVLGTWTGATGPLGILIAMGKVFVTAGTSSPGALYEIDPTAAPGAVTTLISTLPGLPTGIAFDGNKIWTANGSGSVSIIIPGTWTFENATVGFTALDGIVFDGSHMWVTDFVKSQLDELNSDGSIKGTPTSVGSTPAFPAFDGANIWVPNFGDSSLTVVRASDGTVLKTFSSGNGDQNGLDQPNAAAFDGQRILVTNENAGLSLFQSTNLSPLGAISTPGVTTPFGVCSDGVNFWASFNGSGKIGVF